MAGPWVDTRGVKGRLDAFFRTKRRAFDRFGASVNQIFEAYVFASVAASYQASGWQVSFVHPPSTKGKPSLLRLKFSTRGRPANYSFVLCQRDGEAVEIRHQLRVQTGFHSPASKPVASLVLDVAVIRQTDLSNSSSLDALENGRLVTFGEAKHMSAFAELVAGFVGVVHEMQPARLKRHWRPPQHPAPFLFVSGFLFPSAAGVVQSLQRRRYQLNVFTQDQPLPGAIPLIIGPVRAP